MYLSADFQGNVWNEEASGETYWTEHACKPVDFARSVNAASS